jgi:hypothetical protein
MNLYEKLSKIQVEMKCNKGQYNSFGKYSYRSCEDIQEAVKPYLKDLKCVLVISDEIVMIGDRYYIKATATITDSESEASISNTSYAREEFDKKGMDASQITGSTSSYARKYALNGLLCLDDVKDVDNGKSEDKPERQSDKKSDNDFAKHDELVGQFHREIQRTGKSLKWFLDNSKVTDAKYIKTVDLNKYLETLKKLPDKEVQ